MNKVVWLVAGNKGGSGKSVTSKSLIDWLYKLDQPITVVEGDLRTPDVAAVYAQSSHDDGATEERIILPCMRFDLHDASGWPAFSDYLCTADEDGVLVNGHVVTNLPDGISDRAMLFFERFVHLVQAYGFRVRVLFVMNTLPDGLHFFGRLVQTFSDVIPVKNLAFGKVRQFEYFDAAYGLEFDDRVLLLPAMAPRIMQVVRESNYSFSDFLAQRGNQRSNTFHAKLVVAEWRDNMLEAFDDALYTD